MVMAVSILSVPLTGNALTATSTQLVSYWDCEETSGVRVDSHGTNDLTDNNTVGYSASGKIGNACLFVPANSEYLSRADASLTGIALDSPWTLVNWVYLENVPASYSVFFSKDTKAYFINSAGKLKHDFSSSWEDPSTFTLDTWVMVSIVYDGDSTKIYYNTTEKNDSSGTVADNTNPIYFGAYVGPQLYHDGMMDEISWWNTALSSSDITELYNSGAGLSYADFFPTSTTSTSTATTTSTVDVEELKWVLELYLAIFMFLVFTWLGYRFTKFFI